MFHQNSPLIIINFRDEKVKVLKAVPELSLSDVVLGQVGEYLLLVVVVVVMVSLLSC